MKILSFGEVLWDVFPDYKTLGGAPFNFAAHSAIQGAEAYLLSATGNDELGETTLNEIKKYNVRTDYVSCIQDKETGKCLVTLDENKVPSYNLLKDVSYDYIRKPEFSGEKFDVFAFGTLSLRSNYNSETVKSIISENIAEEIYCDLNIRPPYYNKESIFLCLEHATIVKISDEELPIINNIVFNENYSPEESAKLLSDKFPQLKIIVITKGGNGSLAYNCKKQSFCHSEAVSANVVSTVGAGDSFGAAFLVTYFKTGNTDEALSVASRVSAKVVESSEAVPQELMK